MTEIFKALSEESRLRMLSLLLDQELCVCDIEDCLKMTQSNVSRHLNVLKKANILESYKRAQWTHYCISSSFKEEHKELWQYLKYRLKELDTFEGDYQALQSYKEKDNRCI